VKSSSKQKIVYAILGVAIVLAGVIINKILVQTAPKATKASSPKIALVVETKSFTPDVQKVFINTYGRINAKNKSAIVSEVNGKVLYISDKLIPGSEVKKGEVLIKIDSTNYKSVAEQKKASVKNAEAALLLEEGRVDVAKKEVELLSKVLPEGKDSPLALREPQLAQAKATLESAKADYAKALKDLERCSIKAPYDGVIESKNISLGEYATSSKELFSIVGSGEFWIEADVRDEDIKFIDFGQSVAHITPVGSDMQIEGKVVGQIPSVDAKTQKSRVLVQMDTQVLLDGMFANVQIEGKDIANSVKLPYSLIRDGSVVWLEDNGSLRYKDINILFKGDEFVITDSLGKDESVVLTNLNSPAEGIAIKPKEDKK